MSFLTDLQSACAIVRENEPLSKHTSFAIGGPADFYAEVHHRSELLAIHRLIQAYPAPVFFIGAGSNLLVSDRGIRGLVVILKGDFRQFQMDGHRVTTGAGVWMPTLAKQTAERGLAGLESLIGVPGTIGGGLVMNAGTRDGVLGDHVEAVEVIGSDSIPRSLQKQDFAFEYRHSSLEGRWILGATLGLKTEDRTSIISRIDTYLQYRSRTQPLATSNCGSVFKNPPGAAAAALIEQSGFKGKIVGGARVSERHANFIINENKATAADVHALIAQIQKTVLEKFNVRLIPEVKSVGDWSASDLSVWQ